MLLVLLDPRRERLVVPKVQGLPPCNPKRTPGGPFARQEVLNRPGSLLVAHREEGHKTQLPGVQVAVWLEYGRTDTQRESGIGCSPR